MLGYGTACNGEIFVFMGGGFLLRVDVIGLIARISCVAHEWLVYT